MPIRRPRADEVPAIRAFVQLIVAELYPGLIAQPPAGIGDEDWTQGWISVDDGGAILGVLMTTEEWIDDLWIARDHRGTGTGAALLAHGEQEIRKAGYATAHLRVIASSKARAFYERNGWTVSREFTHERYPTLQMVELEKTLS